SSGVEQAVVIKVRATQAGARARGTDGLMWDFISAGSLVAAGDYPVPGPGRTHPAVVRGDAGKVTPKRWSIPDEQHLPRLDRTARVFGEGFRPGVQGHHRHDRGLAEGGHHAG